MRPSPAVLWVCLLGLLLAFPVMARGQISQLPPVDESEIRFPADFDQVEFYLITVDVGDNVWDNFGHTALRMIDHNSDTDLVFNWGMFDTSVGYIRFAANFMRGIMDYQLGVSPPGWELGRYQQEGRTVWQDRLVLSNEQKQRLYQRLAWNLRDENIFYEYDYFFDNCTTRVRDYLNEALQGELASDTQALTRTTFRDEVRAHYASRPLIYFSLDVLMNERIDRPMTRWERMFLPLELRNELQRQGLLTDSQVLMRFDSPAPGINPYYLVALLLIPMGFLLLCLRRASIASFSSQPGFTLRMAGVSYRVLGLLGLIIAVPSGIYGTIMVLSWLFSGHEDLHANLNLLLFWPTDLLAALVALRWLWAGKAWTVSDNRYQLVMAYLFCHVLSAVFYVAISLTGVTEQSVGSILLFVLPVLLLFTVLVATAGFARVRSIRFG